MHRVLLIESNPEHARLVVERLHAIGKDIHMDYAGTYKRTLTLLKRYPYDCIATEVSVPDYTGESLIGTLRGLYPKTPLIVITGRSDMQTLTMLRRYGAAECILKTRDSLDTLAQVVRKKVLKQQWREHPLSHPADLFGKVLHGVEKSVSKKMRTFGKKARRLIRKKRPYRPSF